MIGDFYEPQKKNYETPAEEAKVRYVVEGYDKD